MFFNKELIAIFRKEKKDIFLLHHLTQLKQSQFDVSSYSKCLYKVVKVQEEEKKWKQMNSNFEVNWWNYYTVSGKINHHLTCTV